MRNGKRREMAAKKRTGQEKETKKGKDRKKRKWRRGQGKGGKVRE